MKNLTPLAQRETEAIWKDLKQACYQPLYIVIFLMACLAGLDWSAYHWAAKCMFIAFAILLGLAASRRIAGLVSELHRRDRRDSNKTNGH
jgi:hypothetical protein